MTFKATSQRFYLLIMAVLILLPSIVTNQLSTFRIGLGMLFLLLMGIHYKLDLEKDTITYSMLFFSVLIYKKSVTPAHIQKITSKWVGLKRGAIIYVNKGLNIRALHFYPENVIQELETFAGEHGLEYEKKN